MPFQQSSASWNLGNFQHLYIGICGLGALQLAPQKAIQHPSIWLPAGGPRVLQSSGKIHVSPAVPMGCEDREAWWFPEHKAVQIIWKSQLHEISLQVLQSKKEKDSISLIVQKLDDKSLVVVWIIQSRLQGLLCSIPKAILQSVSYPHLIFLPSIPSIFLSFLVPLWDTGHLRGRSRSVSVSVVGGVCRPGRPGKFLRFHTFSLFPSSLAVFQNGLVRGSFSPQSKISHIL